MRAQLIGRARGDLLPDGDTVAYRNGRLCGHTGSLPKRQRNGVRRYLFNAVDCDFVIRRNTGPCGNPCGGREPSRAFGARPPFPFRALVADAVLRQTLLDKAVDAARLQLHGTGKQFADTAFAAGSSRRASRSPPQKDRRRMMRCGSIGWPSRWRGQSWVQ